MATNEAVSVSTAGWAVTYGRGGTVYITANEVDVRLWQDLSALSSSNRSITPRLASLKWAIDAMWCYYATYRSVWVFSLNIILKVGINIK